jgi:hypothetical protein
MVALQEVGRRRRYDATYRRIASAVPIWRIVSTSTFMRMSCVSLSTMVMRKSLFGDADRWSRYRFNVAVLSCAKQQ